MPTNSRQSSPAHKSPCARGQGRNVSVRPSPTAARSGLIDVLGWCAEQPAGARRTCVLARCLNEQTETWHAVVVTNDPTIALPGAVPARNVDIVGAQQKPVGSLVSTDWVMVGRGICCHPKALAESLHRQVEAGLDVLVKLEADAVVDAHKRVEQAVIQLS